MWAAAGPPSSIHHPACEVWNFCRCTRVFVCISECLRVMMLCQGLSDSSGRSLRHVVIQQTHKKHNLAPSFHLPSTLAPRKRKTKQNVHNGSAAGSWSYSTAATRAAQHRDKTWDGRRPGVAFPEEWASGSSTGVIPHSFPAVRAGSLCRGRESGLMLLIKRDRRHGGQDQTSSIQWRRCIEDVRVSWYSLDWKGP